MSAADIPYISPAIAAPLFGLKKSQIKKTECFPLTTESSNYIFPPLEGSKCTNRWLFLSGVLCSFFYDQNTLNATLENCMSLKRKQGARVTRISLTVSCAPLQSRSSSVLCLDFSIVHKRTKNALFADFTRLDCIGKQGDEKLLYWKRNVIKF